MAEPPAIDPLTWWQLPPDAQRILSGHSMACCINLWFETDGTPSLPPNDMGERLGLLLLEHGNIHDAIRCACEFTLAMANLEKT